MLIYEKNSKNCLRLFQEKLEYFFNETNKVGYLLYYTQLLVLERCVYILVSSLLTSNLLVFEFEFMGITAIKLFSSY